MRIVTLNFLFTFFLLACDSTKIVAEKQDPSSVLLDFYFVRHGETNWGKEDLLNGPQDLELNQVGLQQAKEAGLVLKKVLGGSPHANAKIVTSSLKRAIETANKISEITGIPMASQEDGLKERYYGDYRLCENNADTPPDAETTEAFQMRVVEALFKVLLKNYHSKPLIIVSHQKVFEWVSEFLTKSKGRLTQGGIGHFTLHSDGTWKLEILDLNKKSEGR
jgi:broad specificity phosphatase PhoE